MGIHRIPAELRTKDLFHHIDMGFLNRRLCITALPAPIRAYYFEHQKPGTDHMTVLNNDHLLVTMLIDVCERVDAPTLLEALTLQRSKHLFRSTEQLAPCPELYEAERVDHAVALAVEFGKPVRIAYHTEHLRSSTGKMTLSMGGYPQSIIGVLHDHPDRFEIEPLVIGAPWFDHPRNGKASAALMWMGRNIGEILPEDIAQFSKMKEVTVGSAEEWMSAMKSIPEAQVKEGFAGLLAEPTKKDWGGENNDHFSGNVTVGGQRRTAAFLLKGPADFREMTLDMCGKRADQIHRLAKSGAEISIVQHCHLIGETVRDTLRQQTVYPGKLRKYCVIDGQATYRILKAYSKL